MNSQNINLLIVSDYLDKNFLVKLIDKVAKIITRKIRYIIMNLLKAKNYLTKPDSTEYLIIWKEAE